MNSRSTRRPPGTGGRRNERGSASVQLVVFIPLLLLIQFGGLQAALYHHARAVAIGAAQEGARAAATENGSVAAGVAAAESFAADVGRDALGQVVVTGQRSATTATITVTGQSLTVIPGWEPQVSQSAALPVERLTR